MFFSFPTSSHFSVWSCKRSITTEDKELLIEIGFSTRSECLIYSCLLVSNLLSALSEDSCCFTCLTLAAWVFFFPFSVRVSKYFPCSCACEHFTAVLHFKSLRELSVYGSQNVDSISSSPTGLLCDVRPVILFSSVEQEYGPPFSWSHRSLSTLQ